MYSETLENFIASPSSGIHCELLLYLFTDQIQDGIMEDKKQ